MPTNNPIGNLASPVTVLPSIGLHYAQKLAKLDIHNLHDLIHHYPFRYTDLSHTTTIDNLSEGETVTLSGTIIAIKTVYLRSGKNMQRATFSDGSGNIEITWFNQPYLVKTLTHHSHVSISGKIKRFGRHLSLSSPQYELITNHQPLSAKLHTGRLVPVYPETAGLTSKWLRAKINQLLKLLPQHYDSLPPDIVHKFQLIPLAEALKQIHYPANNAEYLQAKHRLGFEELLQYQLLAQSRKRLRQSIHNHFPVSLKRKLYSDFVSSFPFQLTHGQNQAIQDIFKDMAQTTPMNRLIQGDVGSGKTAVAAVAAYAAIKSGYQVAFMVPTETLANQHYVNLSRLFDPFNIKLELATKSHRKNLTQVDMVIGTQALLHRQLPNHIGLVIIDEQHRFGVTQRHQLIDQTKPPHILSLTATPIPRTIALTLYSELDITAIKDMPPGRLPVKTHVVPESKRADAQTWVRNQIQQGHQVYIVCPLIFSQDDPHQNEIKSAESEYQHLSQNIFPDLKIGLIHGQLSSKDKDTAIKHFANQDFNILVATPVIEVGIDIPNATIMVIEGAERFGLASLHQLRGRVGRGKAQSYCLLFTSTKQQPSLNRLKELETHHNGLELAEIDLHLRGQGELYGLKQSGHIQLKIASLHDIELIQASHQAANLMLDQDPQLLIKSHGLCYNT